MAGSFLLLLWVLRALCAEDRALDQSEARIIGGREAVPHSYPYMVSLQRDHSLLCGGVLIHRKWVLTAGHCMTDKKEELTLVLGLHDYQGPGLSFHIEAAVRHPDYVPMPRLENDLMLLKLKGQVKPSKTVKVLDLLHRVPPTGARCRMAGWGKTEESGPPARKLQELNVSVLDTRMCNNSRFWHGQLPVNTLCLEATYPKTQGLCNGDSGGPLICGKGKVAGILSFASKTCVDVFKPPVATVLVPYRSWIKKVIAGGPKLKPNAQDDQDPSPAKSVL